MKYKDIKADDLQKLIDEHKAPIVLEYKGNSIQNVRIALGDSHFKIAVGSYEVSAQIPEVEEKWKVEAAFLEGVVGSKEFDSESEADEFVQSLKDKYETVHDELKINKEKLTNCSDLRFLPSQLQPRLS